MTIVTPFGSTALFSSGLTLLQPNEAERKGYYASIAAPVIVPTSLPRQATDEELDAIIAGPDTRRVMQLSYLPKHIGEQLLQACTQNGPDNFNEHAPYEPIAPGIQGLPIDCRFDDANQLTVSVNANVINSLTGRPSKVGFHMDTYNNPDLSLLIGNMGPGEHWHSIVPEFNRDESNGPHPVDRLAFLEAHPDPASIKLYWLKLRAPEDGHIEVLLNAPVAWAMHDGSTILCPEPSTAFFCAIDPVPLGAYPSPLVQ